MTFNRQLAAPVKLSNGVTLPPNTYISMNHYSSQRDLELYPNPLKFDGLGFFKLWQKESEGDRHQFASINSTEPWWGVGKFACPGRVWASAQIKLLLMVILMRYDIAFPDGQKTTPVRAAVGEKLKTSPTQRFLLSQKDPLV